MRGCPQDISMQFGCIEQIEDQCRCTKNSTFVALSSDVRLVCAARSKRVD
jgi:hypothetical protein